MGQITKRQTLTLKSVPEHSTKNVEPMLLPRGHRMLVLLTGNCNGIPITESAKHFRKNNKTMPLENKKLGVESQYY